MSPCCWRATSAAPRRCSDSSRARPDRPSAIDVGEFVTLDFASLEPMIESFLESRDVEPRHIEAATFGVAGAVTDQVARLTNVPWLVDGSAVGERLGIRETHVLNDLEALAFGVTVLEPGELRMLQRGVPHPHGNAAVIAAGTGLGEALLLNINGRFEPGASEGGHADFAARTPREIELLRELTRIYRTSQRRVDPLGSWFGERLSVHASIVRNERRQARSAPFRQRFSARALDRYRIQRNCRRKSAAQRLIARASNAWRRSTSSSAVYGAGGGQHRAAHGGDCRCLRRRRYRAEDSAGARIGHVSSTPSGRRNRWPTTLPPFPSP